MFDIRRMRRLDLVIIGVAILVVLVAAVLGISVWRQSVAVKKGTPASRAIDALIAEVRKDPNNMDYRMQLAQALTVSGRDKDAIKQYEEVLKVNKEFVPALSGIGFIALKEKDWATGEKYFQKSLDILKAKGTAADEGQLETVYFYLGTAFMEQKRYEEAVGAFKSAARLKRDAADTYLLLANCYKEMGLPEPQREALDSALAFDPKMPEANYEYGILELNAGNKAAAAEHFRSSADGAPGEARPLDQLDKFGDAALHLADAKKLQKSDPKKALESARIAVAVDPDDIESLVILGALYEANKKPKEAADAYRDALMVEPGNAKATAGLKRVTDGS